MNPRIDVRDTASPLGWGTVPGMTWHHIIPFSLLRDVWNGLVDQQIATQFAEARVAIRQFLLCSRRDWLDLDSLIDRMRAVNTTQRRAGHHELMPLTYAEVMELREAAVWPAWNAVQGPSNRSDDPGNRYFDRYTFGLKPPEPHRMQAIERLFHDFQAFVAAGSAPGPGALRAIGVSISTARPSVFCQGPIKFRPEMWVREAGGLWHKRRAEEARTSGA